MLGAIHPYNKETVPASKNSQSQCLTTENRWIKQRDEDINSGYAFRSKALILQDT